MQDNENYSYISTIITPDETTHYVKDAEAREAISGLEQSKQDVIDGSHKLPAENVSGLATVATTGSYNDLGDKPTIPEGVIVDQAVSTTSENAIANSAITNYVNSKIEDLGQYMQLKGALASEQAIKAVASAKAGDVYINTEDHSEWVCTSDISVATPEAWERLGMTIDLSEYARTSDLGGLAFKSQATGSVQVSGTVSAPTISVEPYEDIITPISSVGSLPSWDATVTNETLIFSFSEGSLPTLGSNVTVLTGIESATATQPTFVGNTSEVTVS